jgi:hypothetical protein
MTFPAQILAANLPDGTPLPKNLAPGAQHSLQSFFPIALVVGSIILGLLVWAVFIRRRPKSRKRGVILDDGTSSGGEESGKRRRRRRRREHRSRNPTRAETGGLPPKGAANAEEPPL